MSEPILDASEERAVAGLLLTDEHRTLVNESIPAALQDEHKTMEKWARYRSNGVYYIAAAGTIAFLVALGYTLWT